VKQWPHLCKLQASCAIGYISPSCTHRRSVHVCKGEEHCDCSNTKFALRRSKTRYQARRRHRSLPVAGPRFRRLRPAQHQSHCSCRRGFPWIGQQPLRGQRWRNATVLVHSTSRMSSCMFRLLARSWISCRNLNSQMMLTRLLPAVHVCIGHTGSWIKVQLGTNKLQKQT